MTDLKAQIEAYLLSRRDWVSSADLVDAFDLADDRIFRTVKGRPGLLSDIAISGDKGHKHITLATTAEWLTFKHRIRRHGIAELVRIRRLDKRRSNVLKTTRRTWLCEKDSGQGILFNPALTAGVGQAAATAITDDATTSPQSCYPSHALGRGVMVADEG